jgi:hypothetical protein
MTGLGNNTARCKRFLGFHVSSRLVLSPQKPARHPVSIKVPWLSVSVPFYMIALVVALTSPRRIHLLPFIILHKL